MAAQDSSLRPCLQAYVKPTYMQLRQQLGILVQSEKKKNLRELTTILKELALYDATLDILPLLIQLVQFEDRKVVRLAHLLLRSLGAKIRRTSDNTVDLRALGKLVVTGQESEKSKNIDAVRSVFALQSYSMLSGDPVTLFDAVWAPLKIAQDDFGKSHHKRLFGRDSNTIALENHALQRISLAACHFRPRLRGAQMLHPSITGIFSEDLVTAQHAMALLDKFATESPGAVASSLSRELPRMCVRAAESGSSAAMQAKAAPEEEPVAPASPKSPSSPKSTAPQPNLAAAQARVHFARICATIAVATSPTSLGPGTKADQETCRIYYRALWQLALDGHNRVFFAAVVGLARCPWAMLENVVVEPEDLATRTSPTKGGHKRRSLLGMILGRIASLVMMGTAGRNPGKVAQSNASGSQEPIEEPIWPLNFDVEEWGTDEACRPLLHECCRVLVLLGQSFVHSIIAKQRNDHLAEVLDRQKKEEDAKARLQAFRKAKQESLVDVFDDEEALLDLEFDGADVKMSRQQGRSPLRFFIPMLAVLATRGSLDHPRCQSIRVAAATAMAWCYDTGPKESLSNSNMKAYLRRAVRGLVADYSICARNEHEANARVWYSSETVPRAFGSTRFMPAAGLGDLFRAVASRAQLDPLFGVVALDLVNDWILLAQSIFEAPGSVDICGRCGCGFARDWREPPAMATQLCPVDMDIIMRIWQMLACLPDGALTPKPAVKAAGKGKKSGPPLVSLTPKPKTPAAVVAPTDQHGDDTATTVRAAVLSHVFRTIDGPRPTRGCPSVDCECHKYFESVRVATPSHVDQHSASIAEYVMRGALWLFGECGHLLTNEVPERYSALFQLPVRETCDDEARAADTPDSAERTDAGQALADLLGMTALSDAPAEPQQRVAVKKSPRTPVNLPRLVFGENHGIRDQAGGEPEVFLDTSNPSMRVSPACVHISDGDIRIICGTVTHFKAIIVRLEQAVCAGLRLGTRRVALQSLVKLALRCGEPLRLHVLEFFASFASSLDPGHALSADIIPANHILDKIYQSRERLLRVIQDGDHQLKDVRALKAAELDDIYSQHSYVVELASLYCTLPESLSPLGLEFGPYLAAAWNRRNPKKKPSRASRAVKSAAGPSMKEQHQAEEKSTAGFADFDQTGLFAAHAKISDNTGLHSASLPPIGPSAIPPASHSKKDPPSKAQAVAKASASVPSKQPVAASKVVTKPEKSPVSDGGSVSERKPAEAAAGTKPVRQPGPAATPIPKPIQAPAVSAAKARRPPAGVPKLPVPPSKARSRPKPKASTSSLGPLVPKK